MLVAACTQAGAAQVRLDGRSFLSTSVTEGGAARPLAAGTRIALRFAPAEIGFSAGCNQMFAAYRLEGGRLVVGDVGSTMTGCEPDLQKQDEWLSAFFRSGPKLSLAGNEVVLESAATTIRLLDREVAEPDLGLVGPLWKLESIISADAVSSVPGRVSATLRFTNGGGVEVETGCNSGTGRAIVEGDRVRLVDVALTRRGCVKPEGQAVEAEMLRLLRADALTYAIDANRLRLMVGDRGVELRGS